MSAGRYDITIEQGATYAQTFTWTDDAGDPVNLTGYTARMKIKTAKGATANIASLTDAAGITLGGAAGTIAVTLTATVTAAYTFKRAVYDLELVNGDTVTRLLEGDVILSKEVTT